MTHLNAIETYVLQVAGALLLALLVALGRRLLQWSGLKVSDQDRAAFVAIARQGAVYAEEQADKFLADRQEKMPSLAKRATAIGYALDEAKREGLRMPTAQQAAAIIEAHLPLLRATGMIPGKPKVPTPIKVALALFAGLGLLCGTRVARAADVSTGLSIAAVEYYPGTHAIVQAAAGAGYQVSVAWLPRVIHGHVFDMLGVELAGYLTHSNGVTRAQLAAMLCTASGLICGGGGRDIYASLGKTGWFLDAAIGIPLGLASSALNGPASAPASQPFGASAPPAPPPSGAKVLLPF